MRSSLLYGTRDPASPREALRIKPERALKTKPHCRVEYTHLILGQGSAVR